MKQRRLTRLIGANISSLDMWSAVGGTGVHRIQDSLFKFAAQLSQAFYLSRIGAGFVWEG